MNFQDTINIGAKSYGGEYVELGGKCYGLNERGNVDFGTNIEYSMEDYDEDGNPVEPTEMIYLEFGKCAILPNTSANKVTLADGSAFVYSYEVLAPLNAKRYKMLPKEGDCVRITKRDGTIDKEMEVKGFTTYKQRYLKIWL